MKMCRLTIALACAAFVILIGTAKAAVLFENPFQLDDTAADANCSPCMGMGRMFDRFTLSSSANITSIDAQLTLSGGNLNYSIWTADRSTQLFSQTFNMNGPSGANLTYEAYRRNDAFNTSWSWNISAPLTGLSLAAGDYYLSIYGDTGGWLNWWFSSVIDDGSYLVTQGHSLGQGRDLAFRINGTYDVAQTPIPAALPLFGTGLGLMGFVGWWRKKRADTAA